MTTSVFYLVKKAVNSLVMDGWCYPIYLWLAKMSRYVGLAYLISAIERRVRVCKRLSINTDKIRLHD
jgi:hypothetical protein